MVTGSEHRPRAQRSAARGLTTATLGPVGVTLAATLVFVAIGGAVAWQAVRHVAAGAGPVDRTLVVALVLNVALILFGWRRAAALHGARTGRDAAEAQAHALATRDVLTGLLNRRMFAVAGADMLSRTAASGRGTALVILDLDHFKSINDMHGHAAGDAILTVVADALAGLLPADAAVARLGGDEFGAIFPLDARAAARVDRIADAIMARMARPFEAGGIACHVSASIGLALADGDAGGFDALMRAADIAMYAAKTAGRNRAIWFDESMERALRVRNALEAGLRTAIPAGQIVPFFEGQVEVATGRLTGFEVLARWQHPTDGLILPDRFIPIAEETGLIADLSLSVMRQALFAAREWSPALVVSVNISPWQLRDAWLAQKIIKVLTETGFPAHRLEVELTETALFDNLALAQTTVASLKNQGVRLALDDFGTGYSSLAHLRALPFDRIKIDRSFVASMTESADSTAIVTAIARLGESLNLPVTAEGVEDADIAARLSAIGITTAQGWHYGKPLSLAATRRLLAERDLLAPALPTRFGAPPAPQPVTSLRRAG